MFMNGFLAYFSRWELVYRMLIKIYQKFVSLNFCCMLLSSLLAAYRWTIKREFTFLYSSHVWLKDHEFSDARHLMKLCTPGKIFLGRQSGLFPTLLWAVDVLKFYMITQLEWFNLGQFPRIFSRTSISLWQLKAIIHKVFLTHLFLSHVNVWDLQIVTIYIAQHR